ncbi:SMI1/KNR4 family protein [Streptomyces cyaneofuscatus]|uniref:SMI1/KNR4 family protein n=1 Tax=Streptomyces cyaneofuscatus TaxID=66883 RepID=UPI0036DDFBD0
MSFDVGQNWLRIETWLSREAPRDALPGPASLEDVEELEARIGVQLPDDVRESLLRHNGTDVVQLVPPNYCLHGTKGMQEKYLSPQFPYRGDRHYVPIAHLGRTQMLVDVRNGQIGKHDVEWGKYVWLESEWATSFARLLEYVANALWSRDGVARLGQDEWQACVTDEDFPETLIWTDEP